MCKNHTGAILILQEHLGVSSAVFLRAKRERIQKQYHADVSVTRKDTQTFLLEVEESLAALVFFYPIIEFDTEERNLPKAIFGLFLEFIAVLCSCRLKGNLDLHSVFDFGNRMVH